jgi:ketosteroid isomerase-like protein
VQTQSILVINALAALLVMGPAIASDSTATDEEAIKALQQKYAAAVNAEPVDIQLASQVWSNSPEVSFIHPLGHEHGWEQIKKNFYEGIMEALFSERELTIRDVNLHVYGDSAWSEFNWHFVAKLRKTGSTVETNGRETQIYRKVDGHRWVLVHVHYSPMPASPERTS